jgi:phosphate transport system protein
MADGITDDIGYMINLLLISRHIERLADHATNIAEEVVYMRGRSSGTAKRT